MGETATVGLMRLGSVVIGLLVVAALLWIGGEMHYRNCVDAAEALPDRRSKLEREVDGFGGEDPHADVVAKRVGGCSRVP